MYLARAWYQKASKDRSFAALRNALTFVQTVSPFSLSWYRIFASSPSFCSFDSLPLPMSSFDKEECVLTVGVSAYL